MTLVARNNGIASEIADEWCRSRRRRTWTLDNATSCCAAFASDSEAMNSYRKPRFHIRYPLTYSTIHTFSVCLLLP